MTSTCFPHRYRIFTWHQRFFTQIFIRHQWFFPWISCFYMTSMVFLIDIVFDMTSMVLSKDIVFFYDIYLFFKFVSNFYMTSMVFPIDIAFLYDINGFSHRYLLRHQWFCPYISYFYMTSTCFPHRYRVFIWHRCFFQQISHSIWHQWFFPYMSYFYMTSMIFPIDIVFLYKIDGFSHRYRIWYDLNGFAHRYRIFLLHLLVFHIYIVFL